MNYINVENIIAADINDCREFGDTSWRNIFSFPTKLITYYDTSLKITDESNTILMEFVTYPGYILEDSNIRKIIFNNYRLIILALNSIVVINFLTNSAYKILDSGVYSFSGNISQRNTELGYISRYPANLFTGYLFDCINIDDNIIFSPYAGKLTIYDYSENTHFQNYNLDYEKCLLSYDLRYSRIWVIDNKNPQYGSIIFPVTSDFSVTMNSTLSISPYSINCICEDSLYLYIGHNDGVTRINKIGSINELSYLTEPVKSISLKMNDRIVFGTENGAFYSLDKNTMIKKLRLGSEIFQGANYYGTK